MTTTAFDTYRAFLKVDGQTVFTRWYGFAFTFPGCESYR